MIGRNAGAGGYFWYWRDGGADDPATFSDHPFTSIERGFVYLVWGLSIVESLLVTCISLAALFANLNSDIARFFSADVNYRSVRLSPVYGQTIVTIGRQL